MAKYLMIAAVLASSHIASALELMEVHDVNDELSDFAHAHHDGYFQRGHGLEHHLDDEHTGSNQDLDRGGGSEQYPVIYPYDHGPHRGDPAGGRFGIQNAGGEWNGGMGHGNDLGEFGEMYGNDHVLGFEGDNHGYFGGHGGYGFEHGFGNEGLMGGHGHGHGNGMDDMEGHHGHSGSEFHEPEVNPDLLGAHPYGSVSGISPNFLHQEEHEEADDAGRHPHSWKHGHHHAHNPHGRYHHNGNGDFETHLHDDF